MSQRSFAYPAVLCYNIWSMEWNNGLPYPYVNFVLVVEIGLFVKINGSNIEFVILWSTKTVVKIGKLINIAKMILYINNPQILLAL